MGAPQQEQMESGGSNPKIAEIFADKKAMLVKQTMRGCIQECLGCEAKSEFLVAPIDFGHMDGYKVSEQAKAQPDIAYVLEESSFCCRLCYPQGRPYEINVSAGGAPGGQELIKHVKPCSFPLNFKIDDITCPCCFNLPKQDDILPNGQPLGSESTYICDENLWVPKLKYKENGEDIYIVKPETCCGGCCIQCFGKGSKCGKGCLFLPFYFHDPLTGLPIGGEYGGENTPQIRQVWPGMKAACCSTADHFVVYFPPGINANRKAGLLGMTFLLDFVVFEGNQNAE